ncbi:MAG: hypothetical protein L6R41_002806 [Letrouitia leprolyta]|nr:MAG: hypothetical protein L6R41_002806 [Letrouitia leprolyta]
MGQNPLTFPYILAPATETIQKAFGILYKLGAINSRIELTAMGKDMARLPIEVNTAFVLLTSPFYQCSDEMLSLVSIIEASNGGNDIFIKVSTKEQRAKIKEIRNQFCHRSGDHITLFNIYMAWRKACNAKTPDDFLKANMLNGRTLESADQTRLQLFRILVKTNKWAISKQDPKKPGYYSHIPKALAAGSFLRVAKREHQSQPRTYETVRHGARVELTAETDRGDPSRDNEWVIYNEYQSDGLSNKTLQLVSAIAPEILVSTQPNYWADTDFLPRGHIQDGMIKVIAKMTGKSEDFVRGDMPSKASQRMPARLLL